MGVASVTDSTGVSSSSSSSASAIIAPDSAAFAALPPLEKAQMMAKYLASKNAIPGSAGLSAAASSSSSSSALASATGIGTVDTNAALARARQLVLQMGSKGGIPGAVDAVDVPQAAQTFIEEVEINDYPPQVMIMLSCIVVLQKL